MNLSEFNALEVGDKVENAMTNGEGTVTKAQTYRTVAGHVVSVKWGPSGIEFSYGVNSTAWMHWNVVPQDCMCGRSAAGDKPCPRPDGKPACYVEDVTK